MTFRADLWLWSTSAGAWVKAACDANGKLQIADDAVVTAEQDTPQNLKTLVFGQVAGNGAYVAIQVDANGRVVIDPSDILEDTPTDDEAEKAPTSNWAHDHAANASAHHTKYTDAEAVSAMGAKADNNPLNHDKYTLEAHKTTHENGGSDEISVAGLSGELADRQKSKVGDSTLGWTADKLLKGAGSGNAPTEIDVPSGYTDAEAVAAVEAAGLSLASGKRINLVQALTSDHTWSGLTASLTAYEDITIFDVVAVYSGGGFLRADADTITRMPVIALACEAISASASGECLLWGFFRDDSWSWTPGGVLYASTTRGNLTQTAPSGGNDVVQRVGIAITATIILLCPDMYFYEV